MTAKTNSPRLRWIVGAAVCVLVTPALLLTSCDNLFGSDSASDPSVPEMPIAALVGTMGTLSEAIEAAEAALRNNGEVAIQETALPIDANCVEEGETFECTVSFVGFEPFLDSGITFRTVEIRENTALTGGITVVFAESPTADTITVNGEIVAANYPAETLSFSNAVLTFSDDGENGDDFPDTVSGTVTVDGTTWQMDHVFQVFLSGVYSSRILNLNALDYLVDLDDPDDTGEGGLVALFLSSYEHYSSGIPESEIPEGVQVLAWDEGEAENMLHLQFTNFDPTDGDGVKVNGTQRGIVNTAGDPDWLSELRADLSAELVDDEGDKFTVVLRDAVLHLPQNWKEPGEWDGITWDGQFGVNGVFFRLDYLLDVMHVIGKMGMMN